MPVYEVDPYFLGLLTKAGFNEDKARKVYSSVLTNIKESILNSDPLEIAGLGTFGQIEGANRQYFHTAPVFQALMENLWVHSDRLTNKEILNIIYKTFSTNGEIEIEATFQQLLANIVTEAAIEQAATMEATALSPEADLTGASLSDTIIYKLPVQPISQEPATPPQEEVIAPVATEVTEVSEVVNIPRDPLYSEDSPTLLVRPDPITSETIEFEAQEETNTNRQTPDVAQPLPEVTGSTPLLIEAETIEPTIKNATEVEADPNNVESSTTLENSITEELPAYETPQAPEFETHYNLGIAYTEMALYEMALQELEIAVVLVDAHDDSQRSRFMHCCNLLGQCYGALRKYAEAEKWLINGLSSPKYTESEYKALRYDLGLIYEAMGRVDKATEAFLDVYALDINFRRVAQRLKALQTRYIKKSRGERRVKLIPVIIRGRTIEGERFEEEALIVNISRQGAGLRSSRKLQSNSFIELRFPEAQRVKVAKVVWCTPVNSPAGGYQAGIMIYNKPPKQSS